MITRELSSAESDEIERRRLGLDVFVEERLPVLADFIQRLQLPNPHFVLLSAEDCLRSCVDRPYAIASRGDGSWYIDEFSMPRCSDDSHSNRKVYVDRGRSLNAATWTDSEWRGLEEYVGMDVADRIRELVAVTTNSTEDLLDAESHLDDINGEFSGGKFAQPGYQPKVLNESALRKLKEYDWPGNVRELKNVLDQAAILTDDPVLTKEDIAGAISEHDGNKSLSSRFLREPGQAISLSERMDEIERHFIQEALDEAGGVQARAAALLEESPQNLAKKIKRLRIETASSTLSKK